MGITRNGPVHNMDSNQPLYMLPSDKRFTRAQAHRLLKANNIQHDPAAPMKQLEYLMDMNNIRPALIPPGKLPGEEKHEPKTVETTETNRKPVLALVKTDLPNNVPKLRAICKERKIPFKRTDKKEELMSRIRDAGAA